MDQNFFRSFWKLLVSQLKAPLECEPEKVVTDVFSSTFLKALETAAADERQEFADLLQEASDVISRTSPDIPDHVSRLNRACLLVLVGWIRGDDTMSADYDLINACVDSSLSVDESIDLLATPALNKAVANFLSDQGKGRLIQVIESELVPRLSTQEEKSRFLSSCPFLANDIQGILSKCVESLTNWRRNGGDLHPILEGIMSTPRVNALFRQLPGVPVLKERFLVILAIALRSSTEDLEIVEEVKKAFFFVPSVGIVMDRWLDKELQKFNADVLKRLKGLGNELRDWLAKVYVETEEWVSIPFGFEEAVLSFIRTHADPESTFKELPCVLTTETVCSILRQFPAWFEIVGDTKARLTPAALAHLAEPIVAEKFNPQPLAQPSAASIGPDDLVDVLLKELLSRLPQHAFLKRPYPAKVQPGVYRFGTREVTFHTKGGRLHVFRVGGYVSESDAIDFLSREFSVPSDRLRAINAPGDAKKPGLGLAGTRRPMEWDNEKLLVRLVRRGLRSKDLLWRRGWESLCSLEGADYSSPATVPKPVLQKFLEQNMAHAVRQDWARDLLYYEDKKGPQDSDSDDAAGIVRPVTKTIDLPSAPPGMIIRPPTQPPEAHPNYKTRLCINFPLGRCTRGATCAYAHGESELRGGGSTISPGSAVMTQHQYYKTRMCQAFLEGRCSRGVACNYAHSEAERSAYASQGVVKREVRSSEDVRLAAKAEMQRTRSRSRDRYRR
jgi:hypothetical protein